MTEPIFEDVSIQQSEPDPLPWRPSTEPDPVPWRMLTLDRAVVSALGSIFNPSPEDDKKPHGPGAPVVREIAVALALLQMSSLLEPGLAHKAMHGAAAAHLADKAGQLTGR